MNKLFSKIVLISALLLTCIALAQTKKSYEVKDRAHYSSDNDSLLVKHLSITTNK